MNEELKARLDLGSGMSIFESLLQDPRFRFVSNEAEGPKESSLAVVDWLIRYGKPLGNKQCAEVMPPGMFTWFSNHPDARTYCEKKKFDLSQDMTDASVRHVHSFVSHLGRRAQTTPQQRPKTPEQRHLQSLLQTAKYKSGKHPFIDEATGRNINQLPERREQQSKHYKSGNNGLIDKATGLHINQLPERKEKVRRSLIAARAAMTARITDYVGPKPEGTMTIMCRECGWTAERNAACYMITCGHCKRKKYLYSLVTQRTINGKKKQVPNYEKFRSDIWKK